jgi:hypothetical protein
MNEKTVNMIVWAVIGLLAIKAIRDLFGSFTDEGPREFYNLPELWDHMNGGGMFHDAPQAERDRVQRNIPALTAAAVAVANAPGIFVDDEGVAMAALRIPQSRFELWWLNRLFFAGSGGAVSGKELGAFLDAFMSNSDKRQVVDIAKALPKYKP